VIVACFLGVPGLLAGAAVATLNLRLPGLLREAWAVGLAVGLVAGALLAVVFYRDAYGNPSPTVSAIGLALSPIPCITNAIAGGWAAIKVRERRFGRTAL